MANPTTVPGDLIVPGNLRVTGSVTPTKARSDILAEAELQAFPIPLTSMRVHDNMAALLPTAGATDDLGIIEGTYGSATPTLQTEDLDSAGATSNRARFLVMLPWEYISAGTITLRFKAGMITNVADASATLDCEAYLQQNDPDDAIGSDLVTTAATTMNSLTFANIDFTVNPSSRAAGDILDVRITTAVNDAGTGAAVIAGISWAQLLCDVR
jgi:hypothetical protein